MNDAALKYAPVDRDKEGSHVHMMSLQQMSKSCRLHGCDRRQRELVDSGFLKGNDMNLMKVYMYVGESMNGLVVLHCA